jgi:hypothetical protein
LQASFQGWERSGVEQAEEGEGEENYFLGFLNSSEFVRSGLSQMLAIAR